MRKSLTVLLFICATFLAGGTAARLNDQPPANRRNFIACPIVRDTKTLPRWLAEYERTARNSSKRKPSRKSARKKWVKSSLASGCLRPS
jgi:hypothetical protein